MKECDNNKEHIPEISGKLLVEYLLPAAHRWLAKRGGVQEALHGIMVMRSKKHTTTAILLRFCKASCVYLSVQHSIAEVHDQWHRH
jgi:hypothetical protein